MYRSDIPIKGILPYHAQGFELTKGASILGSNLDKTVKMVESENYDLVMVIKLIISEWIIFVSKIQLLFLFLNRLQSALQWTHW